MTFFSSSYVTKNLYDKTSNLNSTWDVVFLATEYAVASLPNFLNRPFVLLLLRYRFVSILRNRLQIHHQKCFVEIIAHELSYARRHRHSPYIFIALQKQGFVTSHPTYFFLSRLVCETVVLPVGSLSCGMRIDGRAATVQHFCRFSAHAHPVGW